MAKRAPQTLPADLEIRRYGERLLNAYGSREALLASGLVPGEVKFPKPEDCGRWNRWTIAGVEYALTTRWASSADQAAKRVSNHWWFQRLDPQKTYPADFVEQHKREVAR